MYDILWDVFVMSGYYVRGGGGVYVMGPTHDGCDDVFVVFTMMSV